MSQAEELFSAIAETGTEVELVVYPREGHVPLERAHALDAIRRTQDWFDRHLREGRTTGSPRMWAESGSIHSHSFPTRGVADPWHE